MRRFGVFGISSLLLAIVAIAAEQVEDKAIKLRDIRALFRATQMEEMGRHMAGEILSSALSELEGTSQLSEPQKKQIRGIVQRELDFKKFSELLVPIYDKYFEHSEVRAMLGFYESRVGKKFVEYQPKLLKDTTAAAQVWAQNASERIASAIQREVLQSGRASSRGLAGDADASHPAQKQKR